MYIGKIRINLAGENNTRGDKLSLTFYNNGKYITRRTLYRNIDKSYNLVSNLILNAMFKNGIPQFDVVEQREYEDYRIYTYMVTFLHKSLN